MTIANIGPVRGGPSESSPRAYHSPERKRRADETRSRILDAARSLFLSHGYFPTTIRAIAAQAGVAEPTVYLQFKSKPALLDAVIKAAIGGAAEAVPLAQQFEDVLSSPPREMLLRFGEVHAGVMERTARILALAEAAAIIDPELGELREQGHARRRARFTSIASALHAAGGLGTHIDERETAATIYALASDSVYLSLIDGCGWSSDDYGRWLGRVLTAALGAE